MTKCARILALVAIGLAVLSGAGCNKLRARDQLNKGVQAYKNAKYEEAIGHFQQSVSLDPGLLNARLYLATAFAQQYIPGADTPDNNQSATQAIDEFKKVLDMNPGREQKVTSLKGIASLYFNMKKMEDAKEYHRKVVQLDPNDPEAYYSIAVIDWTQAYQNAAEAKSAEGMKVDDDITKNKKLCPMLQQKNASLVQDGIEDLNKALQLRPDYDDAMAYMNLLYRRKADIDCGDPDARTADLKTADEWVDKTMATKKAKAEKQPGAQGITMDQTTGK
jgi:tetratricopeptide (TPR) repeat protein